MSETGSSYVDEAVVRGLIRKNAGEALPQAAIVAGELDAAYAERLLDITDPTKETKSSPTLGVRVQREIRDREESGYWDQPGREEEVESTLQRFFDGELVPGNMINRQAQTENQLNDITTFIRGVRMFASLLTGQAGGAEEEGEDGGAIDATDAASTPEPDAVTAEGATTAPVAPMFGGMGEIGTDEDPSEGGTDTVISINLLNQKQEALSDEELLKEIVVEPIPGPDRVDLPDEEFPKPDGVEQPVDEEQAESLVVTIEDVNAARDQGSVELASVPTEPNAEPENAASAPVSTEGVGGGDDVSLAPPDSLSAPEPLNPDDKEKISALLKQIVTRDLSAHYYPAVENDIGPFKLSNEYITAREEIKTAWQSQAIQLGLDPDAWDSISENSIDFWTRISSRPKKDQPATKKEIQDGLSTLWLQVEEILGDSLSIEDRADIAKSAIESMVTQINTNQVTQSKDYKAGENYYFNGAKVSLEEIETTMPQLRAGWEEQQKRAAAAQASAEEEKRKKEALVNEARLKEQYFQELNDLSVKFQKLGPTKLKELKNKLVLNSQLPINERASLKDIFETEIDYLNSQLNPDEQLTFHPPDRGVSGLGVEPRVYAYWYEVLNRAHEVVEHPEVRKELRLRIAQQLAEIAKVYGNEQKTTQNGRQSVEYEGLSSEGINAARNYVVDLLKPLKEAYFLGKWTAELRTVVPKNLSLWEYNEELTALAKAVGIDDEPGQQSKIQEVAKKIKSHIRLNPEDGASSDDVYATSQMDLMLSEMVDQSREDRMYGSMMAERGLAEYIFLPQNQEIILRARALSAEERDQWYTNIAYTVLRAGNNSGMAKFFLQAKGGDGETEAEFNAFSKGMEFVHKTMQAAGINNLEDRYKAIGIFKPEEVWYMAEQERSMRARVKERGEIREIDFSLSAMDVWGTYMNSDVLSEIMANKGYKEGSRAEALGKWFKYTIYRRMGYSDAEVSLWQSREYEFKQLLSIGKSTEGEQKKQHWMEQGEYFPEVVWTDEISLSDLTDVTSVEGLMGNNWGMVMYAKNLIDAFRSDYRLLPTDDPKGRENLARSSNGDYARQYGLTTPPGQLINVIALHPDLPSITTRSALVRPLQELVTKGLDLTNNTQRQIAEARMKSIEKLAMIDQVSSSGAKTLGMIAMGEGELDPAKLPRLNKLAAYKTKVRSVMQGIERLDIVTYRDFNHWKDVEFQPTELQNAWEGYDFTPLLLEARMTKREIERMGYDTRGINGWRLFVKQANSGMMKMQRQEVKDQDSTFKYPIMAYNATQGLYKGPLALNFNTAERLVGEFSVPTSQALAANRKGSRFSVTPQQERRQVDRVADAVTAHEKLPKLYGQYTQQFLEAWNEVNFKGFGSSTAQHSMHQAAITAAADSLLAVNLDYIVEDIDLNTLGKDGGNFSVKRITRADFRARWNDHFSQTEIVELERFLREQGFRFVKSAEMKEADAVLVGPNTGYVPKTTSAKKLLHSIVEHVDRETQDLDPNYLNINQAAMLGLKQRSETMLERGYFCWKTLIEEASNVTASVINSATDSLTQGNRISPDMARHMAASNRDLEEDGVYSDTVFVGPFRYRRVATKGARAEWGLVQGKGRGIKTEIHVEGESFWGKFGQFWHEKKH